MNFNTDFDLNPTQILFAFAIIRTIEIILPNHWGLLGRCIGSWLIFFAFLIGSFLIKKVVVKFAKKEEKKIEE